MDFCIITPTAGLKQYATLSKTHLVLAQVKNPAYREFYRNRKLNGDHIILDNGAYEGELNVANYCESIDFYHPDVVVLPDKLDTHWKENLSIAHSFLNKVYDDYPFADWMFVPQTQGSDLLGWIEGVMGALNDSSPFTIEWLGLPRKMVTHYFTQQGPDIRAKACGFFKRYAPQIKIHALGMAAGNVEELQWLRDAGCTSIDSSAPVWRAWTLGLSLTNPDHRAIWNQCGTPCNFDYPIPETAHWDLRHDQILTNLEVCGVDTSQRR